MTRSDWRDPNMPCLRRFFGSVPGTFINRLISPKDAQYISQHSLDNTCVPHFSHDPTYNLNRKARRNG